MVNQLVLGPLIALEITRYEEDGKTHELFREFVGPMDPVSFQLFVQCS